MFSNILNSAKAHMKGSKKYPKIDGIVTFKETKEGVMLTAKISGLPKSKERCKREIFRISYS